MNNEMVKVTVQLTKEMRDELKIKAIRENKYTSNIVRKLIKDYLNNE